MNEFQHSRIDSALLLKVWPSPRLSHDWGEAMWAPPSTSGCCRHAFGAQPSPMGGGLVSRFWDFNLYFPDLLITFRGVNNLHHLPEKVQFFFFSIFLTSLYQSLISQCNTSLQAVTTASGTTGGPQTHHLLRLSNYLAFYCGMCCWWLAWGDPNICFLPGNVCQRRFKSCWVSERDPESDLR